MKSFRLCALSPFLFIALFPAFTSTAFAAHKRPDTSAAKSAADHWLILLDSSEYSKSWTGASEVLKTKTPEASWKDQISKTRTPLGKMLNRHHRLTQTESALPDAPAGTYVIFQYVTSFENKKDATETVTPHLDKDGEWRVSDYSVR